MEKQNRWVVITGGTKGIGRAILEAFLVEGFHGITCARNGKDLSSLRQGLKAAYPAQRVEIFETDLSKEAGCNAFGTFVKEKITQVEVLVNNAGYFLPGQIQNEPEGTLESMMETNLYSAYRVTRSLLPLFLEAKKGHIFNVCSTASIIPYVNGGSYCISKHALLGFSKVLREELKPKGIRVTSILPGATLTSSWEGVDLPKERFMKAEDVGNAVVGCWKLSQHTVVEEILLRPQLGDI